jgi:hypothetical protein
MALDRSQRCTRLAAPVGLTAGVASSASGGGAASEDRGRRIQKRRACCAERMVLRRQVVVDKVVEGEAPYRAAPVAAVPTASTIVITFPAALTRRMGLQARQYCGA